MSYFRITHNGGTYPATHPLAGEDVPRLNVTDLKRRGGAPDRGGQPIRSDLVTVWEPGESRTIEASVEAIRSATHGMLKKYSDEGVLTVEDLSQTAPLEFQDAIAYESATYTPPGGDVTDTITVQVQDADDKLLKITDVTEVTVSVTVDTTASAVLSLPDGTTGTGSGVGASIVVPIENGVGEADVIVTVTGAGSVTLGLTDSGGTGLDVTSTTTVTFS